MPRLLLPTLLLLLLAGCAPATAALPTPSPAPRTYLLHEPALVHDWRIIVGSDFLTSTAGVPILVVDLTVQNTQTQTRTAPAFLLSAAGTQEAPASFSGQRTLPPTIASTTQAQGQLAWSVPVTATHFILTTASAAWVLTS